MTYKKRSLAGLSEYFCKEIFGQKIILRPSELFLNNFIINITNKMSFEPKQVLELIRTRRSIFPSSYTDKKIPREVLDQILESANWAPTHGYTEPWRFVILNDEKKKEIGAFMSELYKKNTPEEKFSPIKFKKLKNNPSKASTLIAICMKRDPKGKIPEWEEMASVAMAVQNMYLMSTAFGIGSFWSSPAPSLAAGELLGLEDGERCLGLFYMGYFEGGVPEGKRESPISEKVTWL